MHLVKHQIKPKLNYGMEKDRMISFIFQYLIFLTLATLLILKKFGTGSIIYLIVNNYSVFFEMNHDQTDHNLC